MALTLRDYAPFLTPRAAADPSGAMARLADALANIRSQDERKRAAVEEEAFQRAALAEKERSARAAIGEQEQERTRKTARDEQVRAKERAATAATMAEQMQHPSGVPSARMIGAPQGIGVRAAPMPAPGMPLGAPSSQPPEPAARTPFQAAPLPDFGAPLGAPTLAERRPAEKISDYTKAPTEEEVATGKRSPRIAPEEDPRETGLAVKVSPKGYEVYDLDTGEVWATRDVDFEGEENQKLAEAYARSLHRDTPDGYAHAARLRVEAPPYLVGVFDSVDKVLGVATSRRNTEMLTAGQKQEEKDDQWSIGRKEIMEEYRRRPTGDGAQGGMESEIALTQRFQRLHRQLLSGNAFAQGRVNKELIVMLEKRASDLDVKLSEGFTTWAEKVMWWFDKGIKGMPKELEARMAVYIEEFAADGLGRIEDEALRMRRTYDMYRRVKPEKARGYGDSLNLILEPFRDEEDPVDLHDRYSVPKTETYIETKMDDAYGVPAPSGGPADIQTDLSPGAAAAGFKSGADFQDWLRANDPGGP